MKTKRSGKLIAIVTAVIMLSAIFPQPALATASHVLVIKQDSKYMTVDGVKKEIDPGLDTKPLFREGRILVPIRVIIEEMGGSIAWVQTDKRIDITLGSIMVKLWLDKKEALVNGNKVTLEVAPQLVTGRTMVPLRFAIENLNADISWNGNTREATIAYDKPGETSAGQNVGINSDDDVTSLIISAFEYTADDYAIKESSGVAYIFLPLSKFKYGFRYPYLYGGGYPDITSTDDDINFTWKKNYEENFLQVDMEVGSSMASIDGQQADIGMGPYVQGSEIMVPINIFVELFEYKTEVFEGASYLEVAEDFPADTLLGTWSSIDSDIYLRYRDYTTGLVTIPSYASSYTFNSDGSFHYGIASSGSFNDMIILWNGKYKVIGYAVVLYDINETIYKGTTETKNIITEPGCIFIEDYNADSDGINIDAIWHHKTQ